ncbi:hypothetical protein [Dokdonella sp.]|uniref:hypothetical protein n=1 Tax=Dokdonella sp. TaxID=2291710 RepID=UPI00378387D6
MLLVSIAFALLLPACSVRDADSSKRDSVVAPEPTAIAPPPVTDLRKAEYSLRWKPFQSLTTVSEVAMWLRTHAQLSADAQQEPAVEVRYFRLSASGPEPSPVRAILRRRGDRSWTYKVRGSDVVPPRAAALVGCDDAAVEGEWDVALDPSGSVFKRTASLSCDVEGTSGKPGSLSASAPPRPCAIRMERMRIPWESHKDVKIEHWTFRPSRSAPPMELLEVSWKGKNKPEDEAAFRQLIKGMPVGTDDRPPSKEELAEACDALG